MEYSLIARVESGLGRARVAQYGKGESSHKQLNMGQESSLALHDKLVIPSRQRPIIAVCFGDEEMYDTSMQVDAEKEKVIVIRG